MKRERYSIIYSSKTGNTKKLAEAIYNTLPQNKCDYYGTVDKIDDVLSNVIYIGFWTEKGNADHLTIDFLNKLKNKKIFLFGTAGYGESEKYFEGIINNVKKNIDSSNTIIGSFMCQGKMPLSVRERDRDRKRERGRNGTPRPRRYGRYNNVILTDTELSGLKTELPDKWEYYLDRLSCHIASTGKQYHSHAATIYKWAQEDAAKGKAAPKQGIPDYSCKEGESL